MIKLNTMDTILYDTQRQGRISFYMTSFGEEASVVASAAALDDADAILSQYREQGSIMWRGWEIKARRDPLPCVPCERAWELNPAPGIRISRTSALPTSMTSARAGKCPSIMVRSPPIHRATYIRCRDLKPG